MKIINKYQCDICGAVYDTEAEAKKCEFTHIMLTGQVTGIYSHAMEYPSWIEVKMADGKTLRYTRSEGL